MYRQINFNYLNFRYRTCRFGVCPYISPSILLLPPRRAGCPRPHRLHACEAPCLRWVAVGRDCWNNSWVINTKKRALCYLVFTTAPLLIKMHFFGEYLPSSLHKLNCLPNFCSLLSQPSLPHSRLILTSPPHELYIAEKTWFSVEPTLILSSGPKLHAFASWCGEIASVFAKSVMQMILLSIMCWWRNSIVYLVHI